MKVLRESGPGIWEIEVGGKLDYVYNDDFLELQRIKEWHKKIEKERTKVIGGTPKCYLCDDNPYFECPKCLSLTTNNE